VDQTRPVRVDAQRLALIATSHGVSGPSFVMSLISQFVFPVPRPTYSMHSFPDELLWIPWDMDYSTCRTGNCLPAILLRCPNARFLVLYFHSNGEDIGSCYPFGSGLRSALEVHVMLVEYPGYGICPGHCSEEALWQVANTAFRFISQVLGWPPEDVIIMGRSLGAAVASRLAQSVVCNGLILVAPFLSLVDALSQYVGVFAHMVVGDMFSNRANMPNITVPLMVIHGQQDKLVSCAHGQQLFQLCPHDRKLLVCPTSMGHNCDLLSDPEYLIRPVFRFFSLPDYNFDDLFVPMEAFNKSLCPQYHNVVELTRNDSPLMQPAGDQEPCSPDGAKSPQLAVEAAETDDKVRRQIIEDKVHLCPRSHAHHSKGVSAISSSICSVISAPHSGMADSSTASSSGSGTVEAMPGEDLVGLPGLQMLDIETGISRFLLETDLLELA